MPTQRGWLIKALEMNRSCPKVSKPSKRVGLETTWVVLVEVFIESTLKVGTAKTLSQPRVDSTLMPFGPAQNSSLWLALG